MIHPTGPTFLPRPPSWHRSEFFQLCRPAWHFFSFDFSSVAGVHHRLWLTLPIVGVKEIFSIFFSDHSSPPLIAGVLPPPSVTANVKSQRYFRNSSFPSLSDTPPPPFQQLPHLATNGCGRVPFSKLLFTDPHRCSAPHSPNTPLPNADPVFLLPTGVVCLLVTATEGVFSHTPADPVDSRHTHRSLRPFIPFLPHLYKLTPSPFPDSLFIVLGWPGIK